MTEPDEPVLPTAYCAPGREDVMRLALWVLRQPVAAVRAHPWLEGWDGIILAPPPGEWPALEIGDLAPLTESGWTTPSVLAGRGVPLPQHGILGSWA